MTTGAEAERAWLVTTGSYSDYRVLAVALSQGEAQQFADAYNAVKDGYRDEADVEDVLLYREGGPLPQRVAHWNGQGDRTWPSDEIVIGEPDPPRVVQGPVVPSAYGFPTQEAVRAALDAAMSDARG